MKTDIEKKQVVRDKYAEIAMASFEQNQVSCCEPTSLEIGVVHQSSCCCGSGEEMDFSIMADQYTNIEGYVSDADLGLGCGLPTEHAKLKKGDRVLDLGSGAGNDVFVARTIVGEHGHVTGLDFTDEMLEKANLNNNKLGFKNVDFVKGEIEDIPLDNDSYDVIISNCVLNLVPDKVKAFSEIARVLKPGGHFCVSDIVLTGPLPQKLSDAAIMYAGCVSGAEMKVDYINIIKASGFKNISILKEKEILIPDHNLVEILNEEEIKDYHSRDTSIVSITIYAEK